MTYDGQLNIDPEKGTITFLMPGGIMVLRIEGIPLPLPTRPYELPEGHYYIGMGPELFNTTNAYLKPVRCNWEKP